MDFLANLFQGFSIAMSPWNLVFAATGAIIGTAIGVLPGLGPPATVALLLPVTYKMDPASACSQGFFMAPCTEGRPLPFF